MCTVGSICIIFDFTNKTFLLRTEWFVTSTLSLSLQFLYTLIDSFVPDNELAIANTAVLHNLDFLYCKHSEMDQGK